MQTFPNPPLSKENIPMKKVICLVVVTLCVSAVAALAVPANKTLVFDKSPLGQVTFSGTVHKDAGLKCKDCHNPEMFPKMKQGTVKITMDEIYEGKLCGACHNGKRSFAAKENCNRCHVKK
jgi:c(7)-type cytochrome triheme protein